MKKYNIDQLHEIANQIFDNKALICPTDTVAGIVSLNQQIIYQIKKRDLSKKIILLVPDTNFTYRFNDEILDKITKKFWPGKLTIIKNGISYRMPNNKFLLDLLKITGPLYCSSANISGHDVIKNYNDVLLQFKDDLKSIIFLDHIYLENNKPSTIYDVDNDAIVRSGDISYESIKQAKQN